MKKTPSLRKPKRQWAAPARAKLRFPRGNGNRVSLQHSRKRASIALVSSDDEDGEDDEDESFQGFTSSSSEAPNGISGPRHPLRRAKRRYQDQPVLPPEHLMVHKVHCGKGINHNHHAATTYFLDAPRLLAGDNKASALRGSILISDIDEHLEENEHISLVIYRTYDCERYHERNSDSFEYLQLSANGLHVVSHLRPYLYVLPTDGPVAHCEAEDMTIISHHLEMGLASLLELNGGIRLDKKTTSSLKSPYLPFYHFRHLIRATLPGVMNDLQREHILVLLNYVESTFGQEYDAADSMFAKGLVSQQHMAKLFGLGEPVVAFVGEQPMGYLSTDIPYVMGNSLSLTCESWGFDGQFTRKSSKLNVSWPATHEEVVNITDLDTYPLKYDKSGLEDRLRRQGIMLWKCRRRRYINYKLPSPNPGVQTASPRYMVDLNTHRQMHADDGDMPTQQDDLGQEAMQRDEPPADPFPLLLPAMVPGYGFHDKKWVDLIIDNIEDIKWNTQAFDRLVLHKNKKELIEALITVHVETAISTDVIEGKGNGLIMLLHGGPGTGKTLTAESIAELTGKPLYRVTCGDIGTNPDEVEKYLETVLLVGTIWGCVVLLDEADVFLEERSQADLQRNALVSVFLRALEYYDGILILTSNRVGTFDEAFKSRVQLALHYPDLNEEGRVEIWTNFIADLDPGSANVEELKSKISILAKSKLNGRQIRNTIKTARQLAYFRRQQLDFTHFERVIEVAEDFETYIEKAHGHSDAEWARDQNFRA